MTHTMVPTWSSFRRRLDHAIWTSHADRPVRFLSSCLYRDVPLGPVRNRYLLTTREIPGVVSAPYRHLGSRNAGRARV